MDCAGGTGSKSGPTVLHGRLEKGGSQTELAQRVGTRQANISRIEAGLANPTLNLIQRLCAVLEIKLNFQPVEQAQPGETLP